MALTPESQGNRHYTFSSVADFFNKRYARGEEATSEKKLFAVDLLLDLAPSSRSLVQVLDLGCGTGKITSMLTRAGWRVSGADISTTAIEGLHARGIDGFVHDVKDPLPLEDETLNVVWTTDLLELVPDVFLFLSEVHRVLKPGGTFVFTAPNMAWWLFRLKGLFGYSSSDLMPPSHCRFWTGRTVRSLLDNEYFELTFLGGVAPVPGLWGIKWMRMNRLNLLSRDLVGLCRRI